MKVKLTTTQNDKLNQAFAHETSCANQYNIAKRNYENAMKTRNNLVEVIIDAHKVDVKLYDYAKTRFEKGELIFTPLKPKSEQIKKELKSAVAKDLKKKKSSTKK
jgi:hypothetical protein